MTRPFPRTPSTNMIENVTIVNICMEERDFGAWFHFVPLIEELSTKIRSANKEIRSVASNMHIPQR